MLTSAGTSTDSGARRGRRPLAGLALGLAGAAALLAPSAPLAAGAPAASAAKTTVFTGRIASGTGGYVNLRGGVRLVLRSKGPFPPNARPFAVRHYTFTLTLSAPPCARQGVRPPRRCVTLAGTLSGGALGTLRNPDVGATFALNGKGHVAPLGAVSASGTTSGLGNINSGRFPLRLLVQNGAGSVTINAHGPLVRGFSSPF